MNSYIKLCFSSILIQLMLLPLFAHAQNTSENTGTLIDHAEVIRGLNKQTFIRGKDFYNLVCAACHGNDGVSLLPRASSFNRDEFKFGSDPYSMWRTITNGAGEMGAQRWLEPEDRYAVIQYIREQFIKDKNPGAYFEITDEYLNGLPKPAQSETELLNMIRENALAGFQEFGQEYYRNHLGDYGKAIYSSLEGRGNNVLIIELAANVRIAYNIHRMSSIAAWEGYLDLSDTKFQLYRGEGEPRVDGMEMEGLDQMKWSYQGRYQQLDRLVSDRTPLPGQWLDYHGHYQHKDKVVLSYSVMGRRILEMPSTEILQGLPVIQHTLKISPGDSWQKLDLGSFIERGSSSVKEGVFLLQNIDASDGLPESEWVHPERSLIMTAPGMGDEIESFIAAGIQGETEGMRWVQDSRHQISLFVPPSKKSQTIRVHRYSGNGMTQLQGFAGYLTGVKQKPFPRPDEFISGGERVWNETIHTEGELNVRNPRYDPIHYGKRNPGAVENLVTIPENYPYVADRIALPFNNPWNSWIRPTGFDFFDDGRLVMSTYAGDVWLAEGIDNNLDAIRWQRIATGLYDPFGVKIVNGEIYVICRDRIMRLNDLNGNGEIDFYESFFADFDVSNIPVQAYNFSLQTDSMGNFLYAKAGQYTNNSDPGNIIRVSPDGKSYESVAIGFRAPNGVTIGPDDRIYVSDNEGNWMPANKISIVKKGGFYGYLSTLSSPDWAPGGPRYRMKNELVQYPDGGNILPDTFDQPIIWMPQAFDNSPGEGVWTPEDWGPLGNRLLHTSFGKGWAYYVMMQDVDGVTQAAVSALPFQFDSGTQRARINPADGQFYMAGVTGWDDAFAVKFGSIDRIRYIGGEGFIIDEVNVRPDGIGISFNQKLNRDVTMNPDRYQVHQWNYRWQERYGSAQWSVKHPDMQGQDEVEVQAVEISEDGKTVLLKISDEVLSPVDQMRIQLNIESDAGELYSDTIYLTIHKVPAEPNH